MTVTMATFAWLPGSDEHLISRFYVGVEPGGDVGWNVQRVPEEEAYTTGVTASAMLAAVACL